MPCNFPLIAEYCIFKGNCKTRYIIDTPACIQHIKGGCHMQYYIKYFQNYVNFKDRSTRMDYWMVVLINIIISLILGTIDRIVFLPMLSVTLLTGLYGLVTIIPSISLAVRRLHDVDRSGLWCLLALVPLVGCIVLIIFFCQSGTQGSNRFGSDPKDMI